ncbi:hypothetical protein WJX79_008341 [Trebouxia sp. C0005]
MSGSGRTSQIPHHVTSYAQKHQINARKLSQRQANSIRGNADSLPQQQSLQAWLFVSTTHLPERHLELRCFGMPRRTIPYHQIM